MERSGLSRRDVDLVCPLQMRRSTFEAVLERFGLEESWAIELEDTSQMSGVGLLLGLDRAAREGRVGEGDLVVLLSAGSGYTGAATVVRWGYAT
jgi:3-oxoacyl-[acyl-carrier-protein] synthase-3